MAIEDSGPPGTGQNVPVASASPPAAPLGQGEVAAGKDPSDASGARVGDLEFTRFAEDIPADARREPGWFEKATHLGGELPGKVGQFRIVRRIKEGGMGAVYEAQQTEPVQRRVAIKIIKRTLDTPETRRRLEVECQSLAKFNHPNIAGFIDCGFCERIPFIVMEYIDGKGILEYCRARVPARGGSQAGEPDLRRRLEIYLQACDGLWHAHQRGVIHRDISSTNVMVTELDGKPLTKLIDFGIAVLAEQRQDAFEAAHSLPGRPSAPAGTVAYMSPEQLRRPPLAVDFRSDVYSMGVLLFEIVTGERPYAVSTEDEARDRYAEMDRPVAPSTKIQDLTHDPAVGRTPDRFKPGDLQRLLRVLRGDLDAIVVKAIEIDPDQRYGSVRELAEDLRAFLADRPLPHARPSGPVTRLRKFVRRNRLACSAAAVALACLLTAAVVSGTAASRFYVQNDNLRGLNAELKEKRREETANREQLAESNRHLRGALAGAYAAQMRGLPESLRKGEFGPVRQVLFSTGISTGEQPEHAGRERGWEWFHLLDRVEASEMVLGLSRRGFVNVLDAGPCVCGVAADWSVWFWKSDTGKFVRTSRLHREPVVASWAGNGFCQTIDESGLMVRWVAENGTPQEPLLTGFEDLKGAVAVFNPEGTLLCVYRPGADKLDLLSTRNGKSVGQLRLRAGVRDVRLSWNKDSLACVARVVEKSWFGKGSVRLFDWNGPLPADDRAGPAETELLDTSVLMPQSLSHAGGRYLLQFPVGAAVYCRDGRRERVRGLALLRCAGIWLGATALSADGRRVVTGGTAEDRAVRVWDIGDSGGQLTADTDDLGAMLGHDREITRVLFTAGNDGVLSASLDGTIRRWRADRPRYARWLSPAVDYDRAKRAGLVVEAPMAWLRFIPERSELLGVFSYYPWLAIWDTESGAVLYQAGKEAGVEEQPSFLPPGFVPVFAGASDNGAMVAFVRREIKLRRDELCLLDLSNRQKPSCVRIWRDPDGEATGLAVSNDGSRVGLSVASRKEGAGDKVMVWERDVEGGKDPWIVLGESAGFHNGLGFDEQGKRLAACGKGLRVWEVRNPQTSSEYPAPLGELRSPAFNRDGTKIAAGVFTRSGTPTEVKVRPAGVAVFDVGKRAAMKFSSPEESFVQGIAWAPSGDRIATAENDHTVRIWSVSDECRLALTLHDTSGFVDSVAWSPNGEWVAAGGPYSGAYLFHGPVRKDHEARFFCRELQRIRPIREHLKVHWKSYKQLTGFEAQLDPVLATSGDDPGTVAEWAWKTFMPVEDPDAVQTVLNTRLERWQEARAPVERAAEFWDREADLQLLLGIAHYRCRNWPGAVVALKKFAAGGENSVGPQLPASDWEDDKAVIGKLYLAMADLQNGQEKDAKRHWTASQDLLEWRQRRRKQEVVAPEAEAAVNPDRAVKLARDEAETHFGKSGGRGP